MPDYPHPIIAREGWPFLAIAIAAAAALSWLGWWIPGALAWLAVLFIVQFFRDPPRVVPQGEGLILAPADGRVVKVEKGRDPYLERDALKISIFMNVFNVHSNRIPADGEIRQKWYSRGTFVNADLDKASLENERNAVWIATPGGVDVVCVQVAGLIARRILCYVAPGERVRRGQRYGFIRFGSRVDVYLPLRARPRTSVGDRVAATTSVIAEVG